MLRHGIYILLISLLSSLYSCSDQTKRSGNDDDFKRLYGQYDRNKYANFDSLIINVHATDSLIRTNDDVKLRWLSYNVKGQCNRYTGDLEKAIDYYEKGINLAKKEHLDSLLAKSYNGIGICYKEKGELAEAIKYILDAIKIYNKLGQNNNKNGSVTNLANIYILKQDYDEALSIINDAIANSSGQQKLIALHIKANIFGEKGLIDSALYIDNSVISQYGTDNNSIILSPFYNNKALCFLERKLTDSSLYYLTKSYKIDSTNKMTKNVGANLQVLASVYAEKNQPGAAKQTYDKAVALFKETENKKNLMTCYEKLTGFYQKQNDWRLSNLYKDSIILINKDIINVSKNNKIETLKIEYESERKDQLIKTQHESIKTQQRSIIFLACILLLTILSITLIIRNQKSRQLLRQQQLINQATFETEQAERSRIARDLHDSVGQKLSVVKMQMSMNAQATAETIKSTTLLDETIQELRNISHNLLPPDLDKGLVAAIENLCEELNYHLSEPNIHLQISQAFKETRLGKQTETVLYRIIQEIINNSVKYAKAKNIGIVMDCTGDQLLFTLNDDGTGFDTKEPKEGIGIKNIRARVHQLNGSVVINSEPGKGTVYNITTPLS